METGRRTPQNDIAARLAEASGGPVRRDEPLAPLTTYRIGGPALYFAEAPSRRGLALLLRAVRTLQLPYVILGGGSNILFGDNGFPGVVIRLTGDFNAWRLEGDTLVAGAGTPLALLVKKTAELGFGGLEPLAGIPGTLGGAVMGNAGTKEGWIGDLLAGVDILTENGEMLTRNRSDINFAYRSSGLENTVILGASFHLKKGQKNDIVTEINNRLSRREESQPQGTGNAGSVFKNPPGDSAGRLIESAGLKGARCGGAVVSDKHANFIINTGHASAQDVRTLISIIQKKVRETFNVPLEPEIKIFGD